MTEAPSATTAVNSADADVATTKALFQVIATRDFAKLPTILHADATWNHRNQDRFAGIHDGIQGIAGFMREAMELTAGTLRPAPDAYMADGEGHVAVLLHLGGTRPDGRSTNDLQMLLLTYDGDKVRSIDHFVGDPAAVAAFWA